MKRNLALDLLKVCLAVFVVGIHTYFLRGSGTFSGDLAVNGLFRVAVPVFFIVNGFFFCRVLERKRILPWLKRVLLLYVVWMTVFLPFYFPGNLSLSSAVLFLKTLVVGYHHIWYLSAFITSGILIFFFRKRSSRFLIITSVILFLAGVCLQYGRAHLQLPQAGLNKLLDIEWISRNFLFIAYPFMVTGVLIQRHGLVRKLPGSLVWSLLVMGCALLLLEAANNYTLLKTTRHSFDSLLALGLVCPMLFLAAARSKWTHESRRLSDLSMVIYFVHPLFISLLVDGIGMTNNGINITCWTLVLSVLAVPLHDVLKSFLGRTFQPSIATG